MTPPPVYLDHAATSPLRAEALQAMLPLLEPAYGNPSSLHAWGRRARAALDDARARLAAVLGATPAEIFFTRGGTEADNLAILGRAAQLPDRAVLVSSLEHPAVLRSAAQVEALPPLPVAPDGVVRLDGLDAALAEQPAVVSLMWANNETGVLQPVAEAAARCNQAGVIFHSDAVQAFGKVRVRVDELPVDLLSLTAHKLGGPRGVGLLFVRRGTALHPLLYGGGQERGVRPGTEDVAGAAGFAAAAEAAAAERETVMTRLAGLRDELERQLAAAIPGLVVHGQGAPRLPTTSCLSIPGADAGTLPAALDLSGIAASSGSACSSGAVTPSHVLTAMGVPAEVAGPSLRFSFGAGNGEGDVRRVCEVLPPLAARLRQP